VAAVQYTFTHIQYTEYRERKIHNNKKVGNADRAPSLRVIQWRFLTTEEKARKTSLRVVEKFPDIPVAVVHYTITHKQYTEQHNEIEYTERTYVTIRMIKLTKEHIT
jgi:hypothetical protein